MTAARRRFLGLLAVLLPLVLLLAWVALRSGPLAAVPVTEVEVVQQALTPTLYGIGTVEARQRHQIGPTLAARVKTLAVDVGDAVRAGDLLGEMDPVDLDERIRALDAAALRAQASLREAQARQAFAASQARRYAELAQARATSDESLQLKRQESDLADAATAAARQDVARTQADAAALRAQRTSLRLRAPVDGIVTAREAEPGSTVVAGQSVVELMVPASLWVQLRLDQSAAQGLAAGLAAQITLRSRTGAPLAGRVLRVEPRADSVTEELLAKLTFDALPQPLPALGELAEATLVLAPLAPAPVIPLAAVQRRGSQRGVWQRSESGLRFVPVTLGRSDQEGQVQVLAGLQAGERVVVHSARALAEGTRVEAVAQLPQAKAGP